MQDRTSEPPTGYPINYTPPGGYTHTTNSYTPSSGGYYAYNKLPPPPPYTAFNQQ